MQEKKRRSIVKTLTYRISSSFITILISYFITGTITFAISIGLADVLVKLVWYYVHERIWDRLQYGKEPKEPEYQI